MSEIDITKLKQNFLKKEILDKGYNISNFVEFLESRKENGNNSSI
jgi:hypothetical protein